MNKAGNEGRRTWSVSTMRQQEILIIVRQDQLAIGVRSQIVVRFRELFVVDPHLERVDDNSDLGVGQD